MKIENQLFMQHFNISNMIYFHVFMLLFFYLNVF